MRQANTDQAVVWATPWRACSRLRSSASRTAPAGLARPDRVLRVLRDDLINGKRPSPALIAPTSATARVE